jgi:hypothetical protein
LYASELRTSIGRGDEASFCEPGVRSGMQEAASDRRCAWRGRARAPVAEIGANGSDAYAPAPQIGTRVDTSARWSSQMRAGAHFPPLPESAEPEGTWSRSVLPGR